MKLINIIHNPRLIDGHIIDDGTEIINTDKDISIQILYQYQRITDREPKACIHLQIGNFLQKDFQERFLFNDEIYIKETNLKSNN